ncbi:MAG: tetratricopeptide repeat protein, partial [Bacteroidia bacterium]|nr:tetratricopeptide repeat protein [Bacteroidia bacterium]
MLKTHTYIIAFTLLFTGTALSQIDKGDVYYDKSEYIKAIPYYKKEIKRKKSEHKQEARIKLANSYRFINQYDSAEVNYRSAIEEGGDINPQVYYDYAQVL